tara:strand:- start:377 stop:1318 length:942 start_codon:yes stop_codon:yes gene_type:complete
MKIIFAYTLIIYLHLITASISTEIKILYKINDSVITNYDISEEVNYLVSLNRNLNQLNDKQLFSNAEKSLIREIIKKDEIDKFYEINYEEEINSENINRIVTNFREKIGYKSNQEFQDFLKVKNIEINELKKKFIIEQFWNQLIFDKYRNLVKIDSDKIQSVLEKLIKDKSEILTFNLSEIVFFEKNREAIKNKSEEIIASIESIGFKDTAVIYSISESSKLGGEIGWVNQNQISKKIFQDIKDLDIGDFSKPIITTGGIIFLKVNDKKKTSTQIDKDKEMKRLIAFEKNRILNEYSIIYYKEIENKAYVEKF